MGATEEELAAAGREYVVGESAPTLAQEAVVAMRPGSGPVSDVADAIRAHPTLNRVVEAAFREVPR